MASCRPCSWAHAGLKPEFAATHEDAADGLERAADTLGPWARRYERGAARPWSPRPPANPAEAATVEALLEGNGPLIRKYFDVL